MGVSLSKHELELLVEMHEQGFTKKSIDDVMALMKMGLVQRAATNPADHSITCELSERGLAVATGRAA